jgi:hypothetical protein
LLSDIELVCLGFRGRRFWLVIVCVRTNTAPPSTITLSEMCSMFRGIVYVALSEFSDIAAAKGYAEVDIHQYRRFRTTLNLYFSRGVFPATCCCAHRGARLQA